MSKHQAPTEISGFDVIIVGAGPAGLSAALVLGRCRRRVLICDSGNPRNSAARSLHGFLTRDGIAPAELLRLGREQLRAYESIQFRQAEVMDAECLQDGFSVLLRDSSWHRSRMLLLATGVVDELPCIEGVDEFYGQSLFHCPYCDGWEVRDQPLAMYKQAANSADSTLELTVWSRDVVLCTDGPAKLSHEDRQKLSWHDIPVHEERIVRLEGAEGQVQGIRFADGTLLPRRAVFFSTSFRQQSDLAARLGCNFIEQPVVDTGRKQQTNIPGLLVAGDAAREAQLAIVAAAEGAKAAFAINAALARADLMCSKGSVSC